MILVLVLVSVSVTSTLLFFQFPIVVLCQLNVSFAGYSVGGGAALAAAAGRDERHPELQRRERPVGEEPREHHHADRPDRHAGLLLREQPAAPGPPHIGPVRGDLQEPGQAVGAVQPCDLPVLGYGLF